MDNEIPTIIEELYLGLYPGPDPKQWPEHLKDDPVQAHGLLSFYRGLQLGVRLCTVCLGGH